MPEHATALAWYDHPFFGKWPAITRNHYGAGTLTYEGTYLSDELQRRVVFDVLQHAGLTGLGQTLPSSIHVKHGVNRFGKRIHYYLNYSSSAQRLVYSYADGVDLPTSQPIAHGQTVTVQPWGVVIVEEK